MNPIVSNGNKLRWKFGNVVDYENEKISDIFAINNFDWKMSVRPNKIRNDYFLAINLCCDTKNNNKNWMCEVNAKIKLINQEGLKCSIQSVLKECYHHDRKKCGIQKLTSWDILDDGYRNENLEIIVEVDLNFKYYDFSKTIPNFTDIVVNVEDTEFHLNKWVLSSKSEYFYDLYVNKEATDSKIELENVKAVDFCYMLASFYPGFNTITEDKYPELTHLAKTFGVPSLHYKCEQFLTSRRDLNVIDKIQIAEENGYEDLMEKMIETLKTPEEIRHIQGTDKFAGLKESTKLRIMYRLLDCV